MPHHSLEECVCLANCFENAVYGCLERSSCTGCVCLFTSRIKLEEFLMDDA